MRWRCSAAAFAHRPYCSQHRLRQHPLRYHPGLLLLFTHDALLLLRLCRHRRRRYLRSRSRQDCCSIHNRLTPGTSGVCVHCIAQHTEFCRRSPCNAEELALVYIRRLVFTRLFLYTVQAKDFLDCQK